MNTSEHDSHWPRWLAGIAVGALAMYFSDPDRGRRRRALVRDQVEHWTKEAACAIDVASRDLANRLQGIRVRATKLISQRGEILGDEALEQRVRARLGRVTSHPRAIKVLAQQGWVNLHGAVLESEKEDVLDTASSTPGVTGVSDNMQAHASPEHIPSLQGSHEIRQSRSVLAPRNWPPSTWALVAAGGCVLGGYSLLRRASANAVLATLGAGLLASGILPASRISRSRSEAAPAEAEDQVRTQQAEGVTGTGIIPKEEFLPLPIGGSSIH